MIRVGIIGCGSIARYRHTPEYYSNKNCKIVAFSDPNLERAKELADQYGGDAFDDYRKILDNPLIDAVSICTPNYTHASITIEALQSGKYVLCEKPMATNLEDAQLMIKTAREARKVLMIGHNQRFTPAHQKVREILERGEMGRVITFRTSFKHRGPEFWSVERGSHTWFFTKESAFFGVLGDLGIHKVDLIRWLLQEEIIEVNAIACTLEKKDGKGNLIQVEDNALCILKTQRGKLGTLEVSWTNYGIEENNTILYCENGVIKIYTDPEYDLVIESKDGNETYYKMGGISTNTRQIRSGVIDSFIDSIMNNKPPEVSGEEGYKALAVIFACIQSSQKKNWILIPCGGSVKFAV
jgi:predicted dehydrogenase